MRFPRWFERIFKPKKPAPIRKPSARPIVECLEDRLQPSTVAAFYTPDGTGNNVAHPTWGSAGSDLIRVGPVGYADGISTPSLPNAMSARDVSNLLNNQADPNDPSQDLATLDGNNLSDFGYSFGQFIDHDLDLTNDGGASMPIAVGADDPIGPNDLPFTRSQTDPNTGTSKSNPLQQATSITSFLDLSQVYGSDATTADALRTHVDGLMKTGPGNMLPLNNTDNFTTPLTMANDGFLPDTSLFATGDVRGNENIELTALQTLFVRNHNRIAGELKAANPTWTDEQLYQEARKINIAQYQQIVYTQYLPDLLGPNALPAYHGYNANVNPTISNEFSTVAFRFGHSLLSPEIERHTNSGTDIADVNPDGSDLSLAFDFFDPTVLDASGAYDPISGHTTSDIGAILKGNADGVANANDLLTTSAVRNLLFGNAGDGGEDLIARDIQRGRDNGIPDYNTLRAAYGLPRVTSFAQITSDVAIQQKLQQAYGDVNHIDAFEGGLAEDHVKGSDLGPLFQRIIANQFARLRDGDRFFYLNQHYTPAEQKLIGQGNTLSKVISANTGVTNLQSDVFVFKASISGNVFMDLNRDGKHTPNEAVLSGFAVQLLNEDGDVVGTTTTDRNGHYSFNQQTGIAGTGNYTVSLVLPDALKTTSKDLGTILISRGDTNIANANFGIYFTAGTPTTVTNTGKTVPVSVPVQLQQLLKLGRDAAANVTTPTDAGPVHPMQDDPQPPPPPPSKGPMTPGVPGQAPPKDDGDGITNPLPPPIGARPHGIRR